MSLSSQVISGSVTALNLIKNYLANPSIAEALLPSPIPAQDPIRTVAIQCESYKEVLDADVSNQLIVDVNKGKTYISDNIAPKPRVWELKGYIGAAPYELIASPILQITQSQKLAYLRGMYKSRQMLVFRTKNGAELVYVGMKNLSIDSDPAVQNRIPITMTLQEIPILSYVDGQLGIPTGTTNIAAGPLSMGTVQSVATIGTAGISGLASLATGIESAATQILALIDSIPIQANKTIKELYQVFLPQLEADTAGFSFIAKVKGNSYTFTFKYGINWNATVSFPDSTKRDAMLSPNMTNWSSYTDFGLFCKTDLMGIGQNDLSKVSLYMVEWA